MQSQFSQIQDAVSCYYDGKIQSGGPTAAGVDWNSEESQTLRFEQLLKIRSGKAPFSLIDYGCGYGALVSYLEGQVSSFDYQGFDISAQMIAQARHLHQTNRSCRFFEEESLLVPSDYTVASGIFNVKLKAHEEEWKQYILATLEKINALSHIGFAFNLLTLYSDPDRMRPDLYYADPSFFFAHCKTQFSKEVALLHDYGLYEFTLLVRKAGGSR